jgi:hypothetical protein
MWSESGVSLRRLFCCPKDRLSLWRRLLFETPFLFRFLAGSQELRRKPTWVKGVGWRLGRIEIGSRVKQIKRGMRRMGCRSICLPC